MLIHYKANAKGWDVVVGKRKVGTIARTRKSLVATFTRPVPLATLDCVSVFVAHLNG